MNAPAKLIGMKDEDIIEGLLNGTLANGMDAWIRMALDCDMDFYRRRHIELCVEALYGTKAVRGSEAWRRVVDGPTEAELDVMRNEFAMLDEDEMLNYFLEDTATEWYMDTFHSLETNEAWNIISANVPRERLDRVLDRAMEYLYTERKEDDGIGWNNEYEEDEGEEEGERKEGEDGDEDDRSVSSYDFIRRGNDGDGAVQASLRYQGWLKAWDKILTEPDEDYVATMPTIRPSNIEHDSAAATHKASKHKIQANSADCVVSVLDAS